MKYYSDYSSYNSNNSIITLNTYNNKVFFNKDNNEQIIKTNRNIFNDKVVIDNNNNVINVINRTSDKIIGILYCNSSTVYDINSKGNKSFLFKPLDRKYSEFIVSTSYKGKDKIYVLIEFLKWEVNNKLPIGNIVHIIGPLGILENEQQVLLYKYNLKHKQRVITKEQINYHKNLISNLQEEETIYNVFSIDPIGCLDIDDAFSFKKYVDFFVIGVHIADLGSFISNYNEYITQPSSIYLIDNVINMINRNYSNNIVSLLENNKRKSLSILFYYNYNYDLLKTSIKELVVNVVKNYNYDEADEIIVNNNKNIKINNDLIDLNHFSNKIFDNEIFDTHILVEKWMILSNNKIGELLYNYDKKNTILRTHNIKDEFIDYSKYNIPNNNKLKEHIKIKSFNSAIYNINTDNVNHYALNINYYTHFTSPIRRLVDLIIHLQLKQYINKMPLLEIDNKIIDNINDFNKRLKKLKFDLDKLKIIDIIQKKEFYETNCYIIGFNNNSINIYIEEFNCEYYISLFNYKLKSLIKTELFEDKIILNYENKNIEFKLFDTIKIRMSALLKEDFLNKKIKIKIIQPNIDFL